MAFGLSKILSSLKTPAATGPRKVVGIDFGSSSVKVVEIELRDDVLTLNTYGELQLGPYAEGGLGSVVSLNKDKRIEALVDIFRESGVTAKEAVFALPLVDSFVTIMSLPAKKDEDIATKVPIEARKYIPVPMNDVALEWTELPSQEEGEALTREILLAAIQNDGLAEMHELMNAVQMMQQPFEIELFSTVRATTREDDSALAIIDVGALMSKLYIVEGGYLRRIHRVRAGGSHVTESIADFAKVTFDEAENMKRNFDGTEENAADIKKIAGKVFDHSFQEFKRVIQQHEARTGKTLQRVVLTGGGSLFHDFASYAGYILDRQIESYNPFDKVAYPAFMEDTLTEISPSFVTALGAALRTFEL